LLQLPDKEKAVHLLQEGEYVVMPRSVWHTVKTTGKTKMLFITPGEGTKNKDV
jgi:quercetin dioxygenase-like cupin family protein